MRSCSQSNSHRTVSWNKKIPPGSSTCNLGAVGPSPRFSPLAWVVLGGTGPCQPPSTAGGVALKPGPAFLCAKSFALSPRSLPFFRSIYMQRRPLFPKICCSCSFPKQRRLTRSTGKEQRLCFHRKSLLTKHERGECVQQELSLSEMSLHSLRDTALGCF